MVNPDTSAPPLRVLETATSFEPSRRERRLALRLRLVQTLHASLDPADVLKRFGAELQRELGIGSIGFRTEGGDLLIEPAPEGRHTCNYQLRLGQHTLGELHLQRRRRFNERELELLEVMAGCLISPLHNALQHRAAVRHATRDTLTGVGNRMAMELAAEREIALARRHRMPASLLVIDLDHFKRVNDSLGHAAGDRALIDTAELLRSTCRDSDSLFRFGGEEFVLLLSQTDEEGAAAIAERIRETVAGHWAGSIGLTLSIGVATLEAGETLSSWFERADHALYAGKQGGRNRVVAAVRRGE